MPLPTTHSYLSDADADDYFVHSFNGQAWMALPVQDKTIALREATKWLEAGLCWKGEKCDSTQPLAWPRVIAETGCCASADCTTLPPAIVQATAELALALHLNKTAIISGGAAGGGATGEVKKQQLGDLSIEFFQARAGDAPVQTSRYGPTAPLVLQRFPWLGDLLGECYMQVSTGAARIIARVRS